MERGSQFQKLYFGYLNPKLMHVLNKVLCWIWCTLSISEHLRCNKWYVKYCSFVYNKHFLRMVKFLSTLFPKNISTNYVEVDFLCGKYYLFCFISSQCFMICVCSFKIYICPWKFWVSLVCRKLYVALLLCNCVYK